MRHPAFRFLHNRQRRTGAGQGVLQVSRTVPHHPLLIVFFIKGRRRTGAGRGVLQVSCAVLRYPLLIVFFIKGWRRTGCPASAPCCPAETHSTNNSFIFFLATQNAFGIVSDSQKLSQNFSKICPNFLKRPGGVRPLQKVRAFFFRIFW